jgi:1,2-diacylglycerol 3-alpha-glucosyltransferase
MLLLFLTPFFPPEVCGLANSVARQAEYFADEGHEVVVAIFGRNRHAEIKSCNLSVEYFKYLGNSPISRRNECSYEFNEFLRSRSWDVVCLHAWSNPIVDIALRCLPHLSGRKILFSHCISANLFFIKRPLRSAYGYLRQRAYWWALPEKIKRLDSLVFLSPHGGDCRFDDLKIARKVNADCHFVSNVISDFAFRLRPQSPPSFAERTILMAIGSYQWQKGFDFVLRAYAKSEALGSIPLHFYGQKFTRYTNYLRKLRLRLGLPEDSIFFHEGQKDERLFETYLSAKLVLFGSYTECQPLALIDATAAGTPFISRDVGCVHSMPGGTTVNTCTQMASQINHLLADRTEWSRLSAISFESSYELYDPRIQFPKLLSLLPG